MTDRDRLVEIITKHLNAGWGHEAQRFADALLAEGVTLPPKPAGPVTSKEAVMAYERCFHTESGASFDTESRTQRRFALDAAMPLLARDHGLLSVAEVERRARGFTNNTIWSPGFVDRLVSALTAPAGVTRANGGAK